MQYNVMYGHRDEEVEIIYYNKATTSYPVHTHTNHITMGYIMDGTVCIMEKNREHRYHPDEHFYILPDLPHTLKAANAIVFVGSFRNPLLKASNKLFVIDVVSFTF